MNDVTIIIPTRAELNCLKTSINSIRSKKRYDDVQILVGADSPTTEVENWCNENKDKLQFRLEIFRPKAGEYRVGIVEMVEKLVQLVDTEFVFYIHDDMALGEFTLENIKKRWEPGRVLSSLRIEPPIYPQSVEKLLADFGFEPEQFKEKEFLEAEQSLVVKHKNINVPGFFAPHFFAKKDWVGYDPVFKPQSREDSDLAMRFMEKGFQLFTVWSSIVYHFSGRGSRKKEGLANDSSEWKKSNSKNEKNYIRKHYTLAHTPHILPMIVPKIPISAHVLVGKEEERIYKFLENVEPYFDEIVFVFDKGNQDKSRQEVERYITDTEANTPTNFKKSKFIFLERNLDNDFAAQTNYAIEHCKNEWTIKLDVDEVFPSNFLGAIRYIIQDATDRNPNISVIGFPRINMLDNKVSNDIPREHWFTDEFNKYPERVNDVKNPDIQFRLHKKNVAWINPVHEVPEPVAKQDFESFTLAMNFNFFHPKDRKRQMEQEQKYHSIVAKPKKGKINKYMYDSVMYTIEGITQHAREEVKQLLNKGNQITLLDTNYNSKFGEVFKNCYAPLDVYNDDYVTIINQPPSRWQRSMFYKNPIGYLAFEGVLPQDWVKIINESPILELWTPSNYCKEIFIASGVKKSIYVIPHGVNPTIWKPKKVTRQDILDLKKDNFLFLAVGTYHNSRKGLDLVAKAFSEEFKKNEKIKLLFKVNKIYSPGEGFNKYILPFINQEGNTNIEFIDTDLSEEELSEIFAVADTYVSPHRSEGFGINILNSLAIGTPVIATQATGNLDICNEDVALMVKVQEVRWAPYITPYERSKWAEPSIQSLKEQMRLAFKGHKTFKKIALGNADKVREVLSWSRVADMIEARVAQIVK